LVANAVSPEPSFVWDGLRPASPIQTLDPMVTTRSRLGGVNRAVALALAIVWLCAGVAGIVLGFVHGPLLLVAIALFAIWYAVLWFRVVARSRLLTWRELATPWRSK